MDDYLGALDSVLGIGAGPGIGPPAGGGEYAPTLTEKKTKEEIRKLQISNEQALRNLVEKKMVKAMLNEIGHQMEVSFVEAGRRESPTMAAKLGIPEKTHELNKLIDAFIKTGIGSMQDRIRKLSRDEAFE